MADKVDATTRSRMMANIKGRDTAPEMFVRRALHAQGFRYRLGGAGLPGRPDLVFPSRKVAVFIHGCFWHRHNCRYFKWPKSNPEFWKTKLERNVLRDRQNCLELKKLGWQVVVLWECSLRESSYKLPNAAIEYLSYILSNAEKTAGR